MEPKLNKIEKLCFAVICTSFLITAVIIFESYRSW